MRYINLHFTLLYFTSDRSGTFKSRLFTRDSKMFRAS